MYPQGGREIIFQLKTKVRFSYYKEKSLQYLVPKRRAARMRYKKKERRRERSFLECTAFATRKALWWGSRAQRRRGTRPVWKGNGLERAQTKGRGGPQAPGERYLREGGRGSLSESGNSKIQEAAATGRHTPAGKNTHLLSKKRSGEKAAEGQEASFPAKKEDLSETRRKRVEQSGKGRARSYKKGKDWSVRRKTQVIYIRTGAGSLTKKKESKWSWKSSSLTSCESRGARAYHLFTAKILGPRKRVQRSRLFREKSATTSIEKKRIITDIYRREKSSRQVKKSCLPRIGRGGGGGCGGVGGGASLYCEGKEGGVIG